VPSLYSRYGRDPTVVAASAVGERSEFIK